MGTDKAWLSFGNETFLQMICNSLANESQQTIIVAAPNQRLPKLPDQVVVVRDVYPGEGPLGGFLTGLEELYRTASTSVAPIWLTACDSPFSNVAVIKALVKQLAAHQSVAVQDDTRIHPLSAVYKSDITPVVQHLFDTGVRRMGAVISECDAKIVQADTLKTLDPELSFLCSVNTPEEFENAKAFHNAKSSGPGITKPKLH